MAVIGGTDLVTDGLTFAVDVLSENCYPGSGTTITDLIGGNVGTLTNSPTIGTSPTKFIDMSGNSGTVVFTDYKPTTLHTDSYSLEIWFTVRTGGGFETLFSQGVGFQTYAKDSKLEIYQSNNGSAYNILNGTKNDTAIGSVGDWCQFVIHRSGSTITFFVNGAADGTVTGLSSTVSATNQSHQYFGTYSGSNYLYAGDIGPVRIYNRALTVAEINQNFNQQRNRFGV